MIVSNILNINKKNTKSYCDTIPLAFFFVLIDNALSSKGYSVTAVS